MLTNYPPAATDTLRNTITKAYRMDEAECDEILLSEAEFQPREVDIILQKAREIVVNSRGFIKKQSNMDKLLHQYDLSTDEGIALMCLAEALLRIPDKSTIDQFISDKLSSVDWKNYRSEKSSLFLNATAWSLLFTGKIYSQSTSRDTTLFSALKRTTSRLGTSMLRPIILKMMTVIGKQFVMGETIQTALKRSHDLMQQGYLFSYDMLGESARSEADVEHYYHAYQEAIKEVGATSNFEVPEKNSGISVKLSALSARFDYTQYDKVKRKVVPLVLHLAQLAKKYNIGLTIDAEEADRLDLTLDIFADVFSHPSLNDWHGLGLALQAYQKRAFYVIDWLVELAKKQRKRIMLRLVKGAYWDAEIKNTQIQGFKDYPVFTRKIATDVSYLACAKKMLANSQYFYSQFGTHNAYSIAAIMQMSADKTQGLEFQCLHGMGRPLYDQFMDTNHHIPIRIYAPVGTYKDLLGYLVRRLLENGANSSFINKLYDEEIPVEKIVYDPVALLKSLQHKHNPAIPLPKDIYKLWQNSEGFDFSDHLVLQKTKQEMDQYLQMDLQSAPIVNGQIRFDKKNAVALTSPLDFNQVIGHVTWAKPNDVDDAITIATKANRTWGLKTVDERAQILEKAAEMLQQQMPAFIAVLTQEGGRWVLDAMSEVREAIDYCRYYAYRARHDFTPLDLPGPTGESNVLSLHPRGLIICISPWNFSLAIFMGQIVAALATGNTVIAKPAEQTPLIGFKTVQLLHAAGIPKDALQLLPGAGDIGKSLVSDPRIAGVIFTGSTDTAKSIEQMLSNRQGPQAMLIAETGGQNAMIVDSSTLPEQTVIDIVQSAFNSAGQRCSALRVLFVQEEIAPRLLQILQGYMQELVVGDPRLLNTDVGPIIDNEARENLIKHYKIMLQNQKLLAEVPMDSNLNGCYFAPCLFELSDLSVLTHEVFGPILHVIRYKSGDLDKVLDAINNTGYGLTLGIQSRIDATIRYIVERMPVGNTYVNRNMIGAVVGVQPFGGEGLSGTGPKAGGPHYLPRLCVERTLTINTTAVGGNAKLVSLLEED